MTPFDVAVAAVVKKIPRGRAWSYAQVAAFAGRAGAARQVVKSLHRQPKLPWWRVIRSDGTIAPQMMPRQAELLEAEGAEVRGRRVIPPEPGRKPRPTPTQARVKRRSSAEK